MKYRLEIVDTEGQTHVEIIESDVFTIDVLDNFYSTLNYKISTCNGQQIQDDNA